MKIKNECYKICEKLNLIIDQQMCEILTPDGYKFKDGSHSFVFGNWDILGYKEKVNWWKLYRFLKRVEKEGLERRW